ncbi:hypothetical protein QYF36_025264 [Acer negundo]|nr:hypothetical protein QYF36_025264 [Acer negundo]
MKNSLIFDSTKSVHLVRWNQSTDCCTWRNVDCDMAGHVIRLDLSEESIYDIDNSTGLFALQHHVSDHVTGLNLSYESISGGIENSTGLFGLRYLRSLNLAFNGFSPIEIPSRLTNLTDLTYLNLSKAGFVGQIPIAISRMTRLVTLDLSTLSSQELLC